MPISINPLTHVIYVPKSYLSLVSGSVYELDVDQFRLDLKDLEDDPDYGIFLLKTHVHETETTLSGTLYARKVRILDPYTVEFEDGQYQVNCVGANHNIGDVKVLNQVSLVINNSAGLIVRVEGSGVTEQDKIDIIDGVWDEDKTGHTGVDTFGGELASKDDLVPASDVADAVWDHSDGAAIVLQIDDIQTTVDFIKSIEGGRWKIESGQMIFYDEDNLTEVARFNITYDANLIPIERQRV